MILRVDGTTIQIRVNWDHHKQDAEVCLNVSRPGINCIARI